MDIRDFRRMREQGERLGRAGLSQRVVDLIAEFDGTHKGAMRLAGRMRVIAAAAGYDEYWREQVGCGEQSEMFALSKVGAPAVPAKR